MFGQLHVLPIALAPRDAGRLISARVELAAERASGFLMAAETIVRVSRRNPRVLVGCTPQSSYGWTAEVPSRFAAANISFRLHWTIETEAGRIRRRSAFRMRLLGREQSGLCFWSMQDADVPTHPGAAPYRGPILDLDAPEEEASRVRAVDVRALDLLCPGAGLDAVAARTDPEAEAGPVRASRAAEAAYPMKMRVVG